MDNFTFRIWDKKNNKWFYFDFYNYLTYKDYISDFLLDGLETYQNSGQLDKNNKKIYSGDIIKRQNRYIGVVIFETGCFKIKWKSGVYYNSPRHIDDYQSSSLEIVGNIRENPEILEVTQNGK